MLTNKLPQYYFSVKTYMRINDTIQLRKNYINYSRFATKQNRNVNQYVVKAVYAMPNNYINFIILYLL